MIVDFSVNAKSSELENRYAQELISVLQESYPGISVKRSKADDSTLDLGSIITIIATSAAATAIAQGIADWLRKRHDATLRIKTNANGGIREITATNVSAKDVVAIANMLNA